MMARRVFAFLNQLILSIQLWFWLRKHTLKDLEANLLALGCTKVRSGNSVIFTTPKRGKIVVIGNEIIINPK